MREDDIHDTLTRRLVEAFPLMTIVLENRDNIPKRPYAVAEIVRVSKTDATLDGAQPINRGFMQVTVITETDAFAHDGVGGGGLGMAEDVAAVFPYGLRLPGPGGEITILKPPQIEQAFRDGPDWRTPVRVDYEAQ